jgi:hypothetical protein
MPEESPGRTWHRCPFGMAITGIAVVRARLPASLPRPPVGFLTHVRCHRSATRCPPATSRCRPRATRLPAIPSPKGSISHVSPSGRIVPALGRPGVAPARLPAWCRSLLRLPAAPPPRSTRRCPVRLGRDRRPSHAPPRSQRQGHGRGRPGSARGRGGRGGGPAQEPWRAHLCSRHRTRARVSARAREGHRGGSPPWACGHRIRSSNHMPLFMRLSLSTSTQALGYPHGIGAAQHAERPWKNQLTPLQVSSS